METSEPHLTLLNQSHSATLDKFSSPRAARLMPDKDHLYLLAFHTSDSIKRDTSARRVVSAYHSSHRIQQSTQSQPERLGIRLFPRNPTCHRPAGSSRSLTAVQATFRYQTAPDRLESAVSSESTSHATF